MVNPGLRMLERATFRVGEAAVILGEAAVILVRVLP